jgi:Mce-associated membrane protein
MSSDTATSDMAVSDTAMTDVDTDTADTETTDTDAGTDTDATATDTADGPITARDAAPDRRRPDHRRGRLLTALLAAVVIALAVTTGVLAWQKHQAADELSTLRAQQADAAHARQIASDYAVAAAKIDYRNFDPWFAALNTNVADPLIQQFTTSEPALRDLLGQLQWVSSGTLVGSDIASQNDGKYEVQVFVNVTTSNVQSPEGVKTTALYPITVDRNGWRITDIAGGVAPLPGN